MRISVFIAFLLLGLAWAVPSGDRHISRKVVTKDFYPESQVVYKGKHDIVNIFLPLSFLGFGDEDSTVTDLKPDLTIYFAEADIAADGKRTYRGFYTLKDGKAKKILDNGVEAAALRDDSSAIYIAATDGIYKYSPENQAVEKYGSVSDNLIGIAHEDVENVLYILTADHYVYRVTDNGNKKEKLDKIVDAQEIVLDHSNNLFYSTSDKKVFVYSNGDVKQVEGLSDASSRLHLFRSPIVFANGVVAVSGDVTYIIYANGSIEDTGLQFQEDSVPTSYNAEGALFQYFGIDRKIYAFDISTKETNLETLRKIKDNSDEYKTAGDKLRLHKSA